MKGCNIVRIGAFDIDLDEIEKVKKNPDAAVKYLGEVEAKWDSYIWYSFFFKFIIFKY